MVADVSSGGACAAMPSSMPAEAAGGAAPALSVPRLLGAGYLAFTVDQGDHTERYQGIVELTGATLADCVHHYFRQSEQLEAGLKLAVGRGGADGDWRVGALMLQRLPPPEDGDGEADDAEDGWRRALAFMASDSAPS